MSLKIPKINTNLPCFDCFLLALLPVSGTLLYFFYELNWLSIIIALLTSSGISFVISKAIQKNRTEKKNEPVKKISKSEFISLIAFLFFTILAFAVLIKSSSDKSLISPWQVVPEKFFFFYTFSAASLFISLGSKNIRQKSKTWLIRIFYFLSFSVCLFIYKAGYGFDPFIHQATMEFIDKHGFIEPKNPYYIGQYSLIIILHRISGLSISFINTWLLAILSAFFLPVSLAKFLKRHAAEQISIPALLVLGSAPFIMSAPQNLAYLFLILSIFSAIKTKSLLLSSLFALASACVHPLAGLAALSFIVFSFWDRYQNKLTDKIKKIGLALIFTGASIAIPAALYIGGGESLSFNQAIIGLKSFGQSIFHFDLAGRESSVLNFSYLFFYNKTLILLIIAISGFFIIRKNKETFSNLKAAHLSSLSALLAFILSLSIKFSDVIAYEQNAYSQRLLIISFLFMLPSILLVLNLAVQKILKQNQVIKIIFLIMASIVLSASLYISYPRLDRYYNSRGYSTSSYDIAAVKAIEQKMTDQRYAVLANQQVSAAALKEFGFEKKVGENSEIYFYPIPTGGKLYEYYLRAVYGAPTKNLMEEAMNFSGTDNVFLVINKYWNRSAELINQAKLEADSWQSIEDEVYIFQYNK